MSDSVDRRSFLQSSAVAGAGLAFLSGLPAVSAEDAKPDPNLVRLDSDIEPLVRVIEDTPRNKLLEEIGSRVKKGLPYREVLAGLLLAGVRNIQPRPNVGFKFHAVLVVNSAHQAAMAGPDKERWLPLFWALDNFKGAQATNIKESGWRMKPVDDSKVPAGRRAAFAAFTTAMDNWDVEAADVAIAGLARTATAGELFDVFAKYGSRDFRDIGHKIIYVANAFRTLEVIGWQYAEPVLRSLAFAILKHDGKNPAKEDLEADRPGRKNAERIRNAVIPGRVTDKPTPEVTKEVLKKLRTATADNMGEEVSDSINFGVMPRFIWDGLFLGAGELLMRQPGIVGLHTLTTLNAMHYCARTTSDANLRLLLTLQAASFLPMFREAMKTRGKVSDATINDLETPDDPAPVKDVNEIFTTLSKDKLSAAQKAITFLKSKPTNAKEIIDTGRLLIFLKGTDSHDYKFSSSVLEDAAYISPEWRNHFLAASLFWMKGTGSADSPLVKRTRAALA
ncbi:MAG: twin-arginine translocation signal domain-containing protein [Planctomycetia bacterium]|nr:twin-arginine translocation signal domain-containing protein [Planctomycetia bacterium]